MSVATATVLTPARTQVSPSAPPSTLYPPYSTAKCGYEPMYGRISEYRGLHDWRPFHHYLLGHAPSVMLLLLRILDG